MSYYNSSSFLYNSTANIGGKGVQYQAPSTDLYRSYSNLNSNAPNYPNTTASFYERSSCGSGSSRSGSFASFRHGPGSGDENNSSSGNSSRAISINRVNIDRDYETSRNNNKRHVTYSDEVRSSSNERRPSYDRSPSVENRSSRHDQHQPWVIETFF